MAWVEPPDFTADNVLTAGELQKLSDNQSELGDAWTAYTPVWDADTTAPIRNNGTLIGAYRQVGKTVDFWISLTTASSTQFGTGNWFFSLPVQAKNALMWCGGWSASHGSTFPSGQLMTTSSALYIRLVQGAAGTLVDATSPVTWDNPDSFRMAGTYESV